MATPDLAVVVTTYQRPWQLRRVLLSLAAQRGVPPFEIVVADDGSEDETPQVVEAFAREFNLPVKFITHPHDGFCPAKARNEGFAATSAPYVLFLDGDCVVPSDHLAIHLRARRPGWVHMTDCFRLEPELTKQFTEEVVLSGQFVNWIPAKEMRRLRRAHWKAVFYHIIRHPTKPRLLGNLAIWRDDFERVNGFDENYRGWGCEDDDLGLRLLRAGVRVVSLRHRTWSFHLWHPRVPTAPQKIREGMNIPYFHRAGRLTRCRNGLHKRAVEDLAIFVNASIEQLQGLPSPLKERLGNLTAGTSCPNGHLPEVEILVYGPGKRFQSAAECRVLVIPPGIEPSKSTLRATDIVCFTGDLPPTVPRCLKKGARLIPPAEATKLWEAIG